MIAPSVPAAEVRVDADLVRALLEEQHPDLAAFDLRPVEAGWDNAIFRLGERFAVRLPRRAAAAPLIQIEQRWLKQLSHSLPLPVPAPIRAGGPGRGFPWPWSIVPWIAGTAADLAPMHDSEATLLAEFLRALHVPAPADAPRNPLRGVPLQARAAFVDESLLRLAMNTELITPRIREAWRKAVNAPVDVDPTWIHGDLHPRNVLTLSGELTGVLDWGDMCSGDCATDLAALWMLIPDRSAHEVAMRTYGASESTRLRARGWAIFFAVVFLETGLAGNTRNAALGTRTLRAISETY